MSYPFALVDVFADEPLSGNPLAVVLGGDELADETLGRIAREFNQSETTFVLAPRAGGDRRLRSFTAGGAEVVGAGHNALGAWWWLVYAGHEPPGRLGQELGDEVLDLTAGTDADGRISIAMRQGRPVVAGEVAVGESLIAALGGAMTGDRAPIVSTGSPHLLVEAPGRGAIDELRPDAPALAAVLAGAGAQGCYVYTRDAPAGADAYARFFNPTVGLWEDPATGSAAGPLAWHLAQRGDVGGAAVVAQGHAMGRPSRISVEVDGDAVTLSGSAVPVVRGELTL
jgi:trans-2,3-dihydro-3-hydroxyanthranilate isomerase